MNILVVEDDYLQADWIVKNLNERLHEANVQLIKTESEFRNLLDAIADHPPDVFVIDVMLRWAYPDPDLAPADEDVQREGYFRAGVRCARLLQTRSETKDIPIVLYTVLEGTDLNNDMKSLPSNIIHLSKQAQIGPLIDAIIHGRRQQES